MLINGGLVRSSRLLERILRILNGIISLITRTPMRHLGLNANLRVCSTIERRLRYLITGLLDVIPIFRRITEVRIIPCLVGILRRLIIDLLYLGLL